MHAKIWKCKFRYSGVRKMYEVWGGGGGPYHWGGGLGSGIRTHIYIYIIYISIEYPYKYFGYPTDTPDTKCSILFEHNVLILKKPLSLITSVE